MKYTMEISKTTEDFVKKIEYVIGAIKKDISNTNSSWKIRHEELRIESFKKLIQRTYAKSLMSSFRKEGDTQAFIF
tara:strand:- start:1079 stop:1306 length:228 start_codon:yes stop_codon:yes gene_type:complete